MLELSEYLKLINEEDAPGLGAPPAGGAPAGAAPAGGDLGAPPAGGAPPSPAGDLGGLSAGAAPLGAPSAAPPPDMSGGLGSPTPTGGTTDAKTAQINLKDGWDALEKYFKK